MLALFGWDAATWATVATAAGTGLLAIVTFALAKATFRMVKEAANQRKLAPMPTVTCQVIVDNQGVSGTYNKLEIYNVGNAAATDVWLQTVTKDATYGSADAPPRRTYLGVVGVGLSTREQLPMQIDQVAVTLSYSNVYGRCFTTRVTIRTCRQGPDAVWRKEEGSERITIEDDHSTGRRSWRRWWRLW